MRVLQTLILRRIGGWRIRRGTIRRKGCEEDMPRLRVFSCNTGEVIPEPDIMKLRNTNFTHYAAEVKKGV